MADHDRANSPWSQLESKPATASSGTAVDHGGRKSPWDKGQKNPSSNSSETIPSWIKNSQPQPEQPKSEQPRIEPQKPAEPVKPEGKPPAEHIPIPPVPWDNRRSETPRPWTPPPLPPWAPQDKPNQAPRPGSDSLPPFNIEVPPLPDIDQGKGKIIEHMRLDNRAGDHNTPDAIVRIPPGFDPSKPINLVIYNHGWYSTVRDSLNNEKLDEQMRNAPANSVLIIPEWQRTAGAANGDQGRFSQENRFRNMVQEIFSKTDGLRGKSWDNVATVDIISHSAGYGPSQSEIYKNGIESKVRSITLLDSNYNATGFDQWLQDNIRELAAGRKQFYNIFNDTNSQSRNQADRVLKMLQRAGLPTSAARIDYNNPNSVLDANDFANSPIIFKFSKSTVGRDGPHGSMPKIYVAPVEAAQRLRAGQPMRSLR